MIKTKSHPYYSKIIPAKTRILLFKLKKRGIRLSVFTKKGNGIKSILRKVGRLTDFQGVFIITDRKSKVYYVSESNSVLQDIQKTARGYRVSDQEFLKQIAHQYGYESLLAGKTYLKSMEVRWLEVFDNNERKALVNALRASPRFV